MFGLDFVTCHHGQERSVQCGGHEVESCADCVHILTPVFIKKYLGSTVCNGDCEWNVIEQICEDKGTFQANYLIQGGKTFIMKTFFLFKQKVKLIQVVHISR